MASRLEQLAKFNLLLKGMEEELHIDDLSTFEKQVLLAVASCAAENEVVKLSSIETHPLAEQISRPSFYRALKTLEESGKIKKMSGKRGYYTLTAENTG